jgi:hypothetical protein
MRLMTFILSSGIALICVPASAQSNTFPQASISTSPCPKYEGHPDCGHDGLARSTAPAPRPVAYGSLWWFSPAQSRARRPANQNPNRNR